VCDRNEYDNTRRINTLIWRDSLAEAKQNRHALMKSRILAELFARPAITQRVILAAKRLKLLGKRDRQ